MAFGFTTSVASNWQVVLIPSPSAGAPGAIDVIVPLSALASIIGALALTAPGIATTLPTSNAGLSTGSLWNNAGVLCIA